MTSVRLIWRRGFLILLSVNLLVLVGCISVALLVLTARVAGRDRGAYRSSGRRW